MKSIIIILSIFLSLNSFSEKVYFINLEDGEKLILENDVIFSNIRFLTKNVFFAQKHYF